MQKHALVHLSLIFYADPAQFLDEWGSRSARKTIKDSPCTAVLDCLQFILAVDAAGVPDCIAVVHPRGNRSIIQQPSSILGQHPAGSIEAPEAESKTIYNPSGVSIPRKVILDSYAKYLQFLTYLPL